MRHHKTHMPVTAHCAGTSSGRRLPALSGTEGSRASFRSRAVSLALTFFCALCAPTFVLSVLTLSFLPSAHAQSQIPDWCKALPRPEYKTLERIKISDPWFEVYRVPGFVLTNPGVRNVSPGVYAIYEPHQFEETIGYLIIGGKRALLFDTGMGISDVKKVVDELTKLPVIVLNSHTHNDHVGGNWQFETVYGMDTDFTRTNAKGSREDAQSELEPGSICGDLPKGFDAKAYVTKPWRISRFLHDGNKIDLGKRTIEIIPTPGHTPDAICLLDRANGLLFTGDTYYPAPIWLFRPETDLDAYVTSVKRLAALAPQIKLVIGAHNVPVAPPSVLPRLVAAIESVRAGKVPAEPQEGGKAIYKVDDISFLLRAGPQGVH
jgi:glyoxylase-like metal-dependent hydrolase (beta-lactamase superfamily II)